MIRLLVLLCSMGVLLACAGQTSDGEEQSVEGAPRQDGRFTNPWVEVQHGSLWGFLRARFNSGKWADYEPEIYQVPTTDPELANASPADNLVITTWIGHSTVLLQHQGINVITDPMFSDYASPLSFAGPKRFTDPALTIDELPTIDVVVISHDHYDHLDKASIRALGNEVKYFVPLGLKAWFVGEGIDAERVTELDWWQSATAEIRGRTLKLTATPTQHFSGRGLFNRNQTLWASWMISWSNFDAWFGGDTGYNGVQFKEIGKRFPDIDLGIVPIGAYAPRWFMGSIHVDPSEAVKIHQDIGAKRSLGIHWGTFLLTAEPVDEPPTLLADTLASVNLSQDVFRAFALGESQRYPISNNSKSTIRNVAPMQALAPRNNHRANE